MARRYSERIIAYGDRAGKALFQMKMGENPGTGPAEWMNALDFNLYGDPAIGIGDHAYEIFVIRGSSDDNLLIVDEYGDLFTAGSLTTGVGTITASGNVREWIVDSSGTVLALVDIDGATPGRMQIKGSLYESGSPSASHVFYVKDDDGNPVASIDSSGNLHLAGAHYTD